jgi:hypothetical protein
MARLRATDVLLPAAVGLWALAVSLTRPTALLPWGLLPDLPVTFFLGIALLVVSAGLELGRHEQSRLRMAAHAVVLVVMLYGTAPLVYSQGRYAWLYKTVGVVQYVNAHGQLDAHIDIYQNWPGFFALAAWFGKVAGVGSPLAYAKWAQLVFELAALPLLYLAYDALKLTTRQRWSALLLYPAANWIGQDYFSPQALGTLLSLGIMAMALRWLARPAARTGPWPRVAIYAGLLLAYFVLTFTHELSPYILAIQLGTLAVARLLRPRWLPVLLGAIAIGYLLPRLEFVNSHFGLFSSIGNFFSNIQPPSHSTTAYPLSQQVIERCAEVLSLGMWVLAALGAWLRRRSGSAIRVLVPLAFSPVVVLAAGGYGNEGILRVFLFSLPWSAALAAAAVAPAGETSGGSHRRATWLHAGALRVPVTLAVTVALFLPAFFGDDSFNSETPTEVAAVTSFLDNAQPGPVYCAIGNAAPVADTARYNQFPLITVFGSGGIAGVAPASPGIADILASAAAGVTHGSQPAYVLITPSMLAYAQAYGVPPPEGLTVLRESLARSPRWKLLVDRAGTVIYQLRAT